MKENWTKTMRNSIPTAVCALLVAMTLLDTAHAESNLDILLVFSDDVSLSTFEKTVVAARYQDVLGEVYGRPGIPFSGQLDGGLRTVEVWPLLTSMSYTAANKHSAVAIQWMKDENAELLPVPSPLRAARELFGNPGADVIIMVVPSTTDNVCGRAPTAPIVAGRFNSETHAFAITYLQDVVPVCRDHIVVPHELGHLLNAEHDTDTNNDDVSPSPDNHATTSTSSGQKSLMWDGIHSLGTEYLSGLFSTNTVPGWADNVDWFSDDAFDIVSTYRATVPPPKPKCETPIQFACTTGGFPKPKYFVSFDEPLGYTATNFTAQRKLSNGSWTTVGGLSNPGCVIDIPDLFEWLTYRVIMDTIYGSNECQVVIFNDPLICTPDY